MTYRVDIFEHDNLQTYLLYAKAVGARMSKHYKRQDMLFPAKVDNRDTNNQYQNEVLDLIDTYSYTEFSSGVRIEFDDMVYYSVVIWPPNSSGRRLIICLFPDAATAVQFRLQME